MGSGFFLFFATIHKSGYENILTIYIKEKEGKIAYELMRASA
jgi:hypothetical protein